jgi:hypothetical protein
MSSTTVNAPPTPIRPENLAVLKVLKDLTLKQTRAKFHLQGLQTSRAEGKQVNGLRRDVRPTFPDLPSDLSIEWEQAHLDFVNRLTDLLITYWERKISVITQELADYSATKIQKETTTAEKTSIATALNDTSEKENTRLNNPKPKPQREWRIPRTKRLRDGNTRPGGSAPGTSGSSTNLNHQPQQL